MCTILIDTCGKPAAEVFPSWKAPNWQGLSEDLETLKVACLRKDCAMVDVDEHSVPNPEINEDLNRMNDFGQRYDDLQVMLLINKIVAPIRKKLDEMIKNGQEGRPSLNQAKVHKVLYVSRQPLCGIVPSFYFYCI
jgi:hypothetical protein